MGMYNEVFKRCPIEGCGGLGYMQIHQIVLGFGGFHLDSPESVAEQLDFEQIQELKEAVESNKWFVCDECHESFSICPEEDKQAKIDLVNSIGGNGKSED